MITYIPGLEMIVIPYLVQNAHRIRFEKLALYLCFAPLLFRPSLVAELRL